MRRVVGAAEAGVRDRMERKVLKAASMGYTQGVRQGEAQAKEDSAKAEVGYEETKRDANETTKDSDELIYLRRELETLRNAQSAGGSVAGYDNAGSVFSEDSAVGTEKLIGRAASGKPSTSSKPPTAPIHQLRIPKEDSAKEASESGAPSTPERDLSNTADDESNVHAFSMRSENPLEAGGSQVTTNSTRPKGTLPLDAGRMPDEVFVGRVVWKQGKTYKTKPGAKSENGEGGGAPTAALWALSVSQRDGKIPGVRHDALDLISSRCQLFFAHDKLSRATLGWAAARWRLACAEPRRARAAAAHFERRRLRRAVAQCFAAWAGHGVEEEPAQLDNEVARRDTRANEPSVFPEFVSPILQPPPRLDRDVAAGLVDQLNELKQQNEELTVSLANARHALESSGPTPREAAHSEKFRLHLQRLQRELEATKQARDAARDSVDRTAREAAREATARQQSLKTQATQTGGPGDLSGLAADDQDAAAAATAIELRAQAAKFHVEFERQAQIAETATAKLRKEASLRARIEDSHRRELSSLRDKHASDLAAARSEWAHQTRVARANATGTSVREDEARYESRIEVEHARHEPDCAAMERTPESPSRRLTADRLVALECEAGQMRHSEKVEEKAKGWEVTAILSEGTLSSPPGSPAKHAATVGTSMPPLASRRHEPEDAWGDAMGSRRRRDPHPVPVTSHLLHVPRPPGSTAGSEQSTRSRAGTAAAVVAAVRAGGASAVDALLASGALDADDDKEDTHSRPGSVVGSAAGSARVVRRPPASATLAVAQLVMRGHGKVDAETAVAAVDGNDVDAAHEWLRQRAQNDAFISSSSNIN